MAIDKNLANAIERLKNGDEASFSIIYEETRSYVYSKCRLIMKDEDSSLDLMQETYIQAYKNISSLQDSDNIFAWLGAIAYRQGMKIYRKDNEVLLDEEASDMFEQIEDLNIDWNPEMSADQKETGNIIAEIIDELPPLQKAALTAFYFDELKIDQIADMYNCSPNTIKSRLNYAKKYLKERVEEKEKKEGYKLHSVSGLPLLILLGLRQMLAGEKYTLSEAKAASLFEGICKALNINVTLQSATSSSEASQSIAETASSKAATTTTEKFAKAEAVKSVAAKSAVAGASAAKTGAIIGGFSAGILAIGFGVAVATGAIPIGNNDKVKAQSSIEEPFISEEPSTEGFANVEPAIEDSAIEEPVIEEPAIDEPVEKETPIIVYTPSISETPSVSETVTPETPSSVEIVPEEPAPEPEPAVSVEPTPEPVASVEPTPEPVASVEPTPEPMVSVEPVTSTEPSSSEQEEEEDPFAGGGGMEIEDIEIEDAD